MSILKKYYRKPVLNMKLPTGGKFIKDLDKSELTVFDEVGIMPITTHNDLELRNPENLLNGEIINQLLADCTTLTMDITKLAKVDIDALLVGIKIATYGKDDEKTFVCTKEDCKHENTISMDLYSLISDINEFKDEYKVTLSNGIMVYLKPTTYGDILRMEQEQLEETTSIKALEKRIKDYSDLDEEEVEKQQSDLYNQISRLVKSLAQSTLITLVNDIIQVITPEGDLVTSNEEILEFVTQLSKSDYELLTNTLTDINEISVKESVPVVCEQCGSKYDLALDYNPTNFFAVDS